MQRHVRQNFETDTHVIRPSSHGGYIFYHRTNQTFFYMGVSESWIMDSF